MNLALTLNITIRQHHVMRLTPRLNTDPRAIVSGVLAIIKLNLYNLDLLIATAKQIHQLQNGWVFHDKGKMRMYSCLPTGQMRRMLAPK